MMEWNFFGILYACNFSSQKGLNLGWGCEEERRKKNLWGGLRRRGERRAWRCGEDRKSWETWGGEEDKEDL